MYSQLKEFIEGKVLSAKEAIPEERLRLLQELSGILNLRIEQDGAMRCVFVCTHNSRRSQLAQLWAHLAANFYKLDSVFFHSGGTEVTACHPNTVSAIKRAGFRVISPPTRNPIHKVFFSDDEAPILLFSKMYSDKSNPSDDFIAVMTCSDAEQNCPFAPGASKQFSLLYTDPKEYDGTEAELQGYDERNLQIASEMFFLMENLKNQ